MAEVREWRTALKNAIERGYPLGADWLAPYRNQAREALHFATVSVSTDADRNVMPFLTNEYNNMGALTDKYLQMTSNMTYIAPDSISNDPLDQQIRTCGRALAAMVSSNQFNDDPACH